MKVVGFFNLSRQYHTFEEIPCNVQLVSLHVAVYVLTKLRTGRSGVRTPGGKEFFPFYKTLTSALWPTEPLIQQVPWSFVGRKLVGTWSLLFWSNADVKSEWRCTSTPVYTFMIWAGITCFSVTRCWVCNLWLGTGEGTCISTVDGRLQAWTWSVGARKQPFIFPLINWNLTLKPGLSIPCVLLGLRDKRARGAVSSPDHTYHGWQSDCPPHPPASYKHSLKDPQFLFPPFPHFEIPWKIISEL
jgi:hypothetical protein